MIGKLAIHQDRAIERTRESDQTHSYWYIPSAPRVNYSLLIMDSTGMMKMATGEGFPLRQVPERAPERFLVATEACGGGTPNLSSSSMFLGQVDLYRRKKSVGRCSRGPLDRGARLVGGAPSYLVDSSRIF